MAGYDDGPIRVITPEDVAGMLRGGEFHEPSRGAFMHAAKCALMSGLITVLSLWLYEMYYSKQVAKLSIYHLKLFAIAAVMGALLCGVGGALGL